MTNTRQALVVLHPFAGLTKGAIITEPAQIRAILGGDQSAFVVPAQLPLDTASSSKTEVDR